MITNTYITFSAILVAALLLINLLITKEILSWVKSRLRVVNLLLILWCLPFVGAFIVYQKTDVSPAWSYNANFEGGSGSVLSSAFMEVDVVFNPGARHMIEMIQDEEKLDLQQENRIVRKDFSVITITKNLG